MWKGKEWVWLGRLLVTAAFLFIIYLLRLLEPVWSFVLGVAGKVLLPFIIAAFIAYLLHPLIDVLQKRRIPRSLSILLVYVIFFGGGAWIIWYFSPVLYQQMEKFLHYLPEYMDQLYAFISHLHHQMETLPPALHESLESAFQQMEDKAENTINGMINKWRDIIDVIVLLLLLPFLVFYLLKDIEAIERMIKRLVPGKWQDEGELLAEAVDEALGDYIRGQFMVAGAVGILSALGLWLIDIPNAVLLGLFIGITDIIPYFGPVIGALPAVLAAAAVSTGKMVTTIILIFVIQQIEGNFLSPYVVGRNVHLHPLIIVFALLLGFELAGFIGLLIAVPIFVVINNIFHTFWHRKKTAEKETEERK
ncbi:Predicted PurR-regulated permease PerM [Alteribacillus persepolensis]|uniref:Predicted PurR-regulated permease PerM n=1 Tax=Alteribacillus persepolensis TaxID=568899 RepID=A0A1G8DJZ6_9BACI|nr:AI-2E family transporter [Alteribacillus persepolensis]SDH57986.1 Predicted PurR-regulated permease PerM [Alteribacillus persepolensis]